MNEDRYDLVACNFGGKYLPLAQVLSLREKDRAPSSQTPILEND